METIGYLTWIDWQVVIAENAYYGYTFSRRLHRLIFDDEDF